MKSTRFLFTIFGLLALTNAFTQQNMPVFIEVPSRVSGVDFLNQINESDSLHIFKYEYLYNGHGIGIADFNNDGMDDIFISGNVVANKMFLNKGSLKFEDITKEAGVKGNGAWRTGVSIADVNGDSWPDIYICHSGPVKCDALSNELYIHQGLKNGMPFFKEMAKDFGLDAPGTLSTQAAFFDYDLDGDLDMFLVNHSNHTFNPYLNTSAIRAIPSLSFGNRLFRNDQSNGDYFKFTDVTADAGIINNALNFGLSVSVSDLNNDGWPDLYTSSDYTEQDYCYLNLGNGKFKQVLQESFSHISKFSMGADIADVNNDGRPDIFTLDMLPEDNYRQKLLKGPDEYDAYNLLVDSGYHHQQMRNMLQLNRGLDPTGKLRFSEIGQLAGISNTDWSWSALFMDFDNDGWKDLMVTNGYLRDYTDNDFLKYTVADAQLKEAAKGNLQFKTYELVKQMPANKLQNYLFRNRGDLTFEKVSDAWGFVKKTISNAAAYADFDNDGDMDLLIGNNNDPVQLFENTTSRHIKRNFIQVALKGIGQNKDAIGAKVFIYTNNPANPIQFQEIMPVKGYQSSVTKLLHFGLGENVKVDSIRVKWIGGNESLLLSPELNQKLIIDQANSQKSGQSIIVGKHTFLDITSSSNLIFDHLENEFVDFKVEVLLPYQLSKMGPALATGDVNGDGLDDVFIGGAIAQSGQLFIQLPGSKFIKATVQPWEAHRESEDVKAIFADFNKDGYNDLYVVSGGNEYEQGAPEYQDRIYMNDGEGNFTFVPRALPELKNGSKNAIAIADIDNDGDTDIFVGGWTIPGSFPEPSRSYLLRNDSKKTEIIFTDITSSWSEALTYPGLIQDIVFHDLDADGKQDLVITGDWMPVKAFKNMGNRFEDVSSKFGFGDKGLWSSVVVSDLNKDGYPDFIVGNVGNNLQFKASDSFPLSLIVTDLDENGANEVLFSYFINGKSYPAASRDELLDQVVPLRKKFIKYHQYASVETADLIPEAKLKTAQILTVSELNHVVYRSNGKSAYEKMILPVLTQSSRIFAANELNGPSPEKTFLLAGNFFPWRTQWGRSDSGLGTLLTFKNNQFELEENSNAGLFIDGDVRNLAVVTNSDNQELVIVVRNNGPVQVLKILK